MVSSGANESPVFFLKNNLLNGKQLQFVDVNICLLYMHAGLDIQVNMGYTMLIVTC